jgi:hypothetical protein
VPLNRRMGRRVKRRRTQGTVCKSVSRHCALVSLWLNSGVPAIGVADRAGLGGILLKIYAFASTSRLTPTPAREATASKHLKMPAQRRETVRTVGVTAPTPAVRARPWIPQPQNPGRTDA